MFKDHRSLYFVSFGLVALLLVGIVQSTTLFATIKTEETKKIPMYLITTRDKLNYEGIEERGYGNYSFWDINQLFEACPPEVVIFVHGWNIDVTKAKERIDRVKMSLEKNDYPYSLVGLSWKSDTEWQAAKSIAKWNGPLLADFIFKLMNNCKEKQPDKEVKIRLIAHSLGARVVLSTLDSLHKNATWNNNTNNFKIASVDLLGAAVDNEEISKNPQDILDDLTNWATVKSDYGTAIEDEVIKFYNLYNPSDKVLGPNSVNPFPYYQFYPSFEGDLALGQNGSQRNITLPKNYVDINVKKEIPFNKDAAGIGNKNCDDIRIITIRPLNMLCMITGPGDSHFGYMGFRNSTDNTKLDNDGAINVVVDNWNNKTTINNNQNLNFTNSNTK